MFAVINYRSILKSHCVLFNYKSYLMMVKLLLIELRLTKSNTGSLEIVLSSSLNAVIWCLFSPYIVLLCDSELIHLKLSRAMSHI